MLRKVVIPAAGLGTRLFPTTKEQPKEMLPIFSRLTSGNVGVKPLLQMVFEQFYDVGFREFCFVVGKGKRSIEDHFSPDGNSVARLKNRGKSDQASDLESFYMKLKASTIIWVNQPEPRGFGHAVLMAQPFVQNENCIVHAGDTYIISEHARHLKSLMEMYNRLSADAAFLVQEMNDPRQHGIVEAEEVGKGVYKILGAVEKPDKPTSNLGIIPIYIFAPVIFEALENTTPNKGEEVQLTDAIQRLVDRSLNVYAIQLNSNRARLDIGSPETYWEALSLSYRLSCSRSERCAH